MPTSYTPFKNMSLAALARKLKAAGPNEEFLEFLSQPDVEALQARVIANLKSPEYKRAMRLRAVSTWLGGSAVLAAGAAAAVAAAGAGPFVQAALAGSVLGLGALARQACLRTTLDTVGLQRVLEAALAPLHLSPLKLRALEAARQANAECREYCATVQQHGRELLGADFHLWDAKLKGVLSAATQRKPAAPAPAPSKARQTPKQVLRTPVPGQVELPPAARPVYVWRNSQMAA